MYIHMYLLSLSLQKNRALVSPARFYFHALSSLCFAGILRYKVDFQSMQLEEDVGWDENFDLDDY